MAFSEGVVQTFPNDTNGRFAWGGYIDGDTKLWLPRMDNSTAKNLRVAPYDGTGAKLFPDAAAAADGVANPTVSKVATYPTLFNETTSDRMRGNTQATIFTSAARTVSTTSSNLTNYNARGAEFHLRVTAKAAATTLTLIVTAVDLVASSFGNSYLNSVAFASAAGPNDYYFVVYPGAVSSDANSNMTVKGIPLPRVYLMTVTPSDASSVTYSLDVTYIL